jgi:hypothetical protein
VHHVRVVGNRFEDWRGMGLAIRNARNVEISDNTFGSAIEDPVVRKTFLRDPFLEGRFAGVYLESVSGALISGNRFEQPAGKDLPVAIEMNVRDVVNVCVPSSR